MFMYELYEHIPTGHMLLSFHMVGFCNLVNLYKSVLVMILLLA